MPSSSVSPPTDGGITIAREQRDRLRYEAIGQLSAVGDIELCLSGGNYGEARAYANRFRDDMRLLDDLGWAEDDGRESFELTMPPAQLRRTLRRYLTWAEGCLRDGWEEGRVDDDDLDLISACNAVLAEVA